jgi:hypothetical protein
MIRTLPHAVLLELPVPSPDRLPGNDPFYEYWSTTHWQALINGYSGYYPPAYLETLHIMRPFPDDASIARLKELGVQYIVVHEQLLEPGDRAALSARIESRPELHYGGRFSDWIGQAWFFELR